MTDRLLAACFAVFSSLSWAGDSNSTFVPKDEFMGLTRKNGIEISGLIKDRPSFELVSVHYRDDKNEIRYIYGNKAAVNGLRDEGKKYANGSLFYKVVFDGERDPAFPASVVPQKSPKLFQVMLYDAEKYKPTGGWTYAVFDGQGKSLPGDPVQTVQTCYACHALVKDRNYVFSFPVSFSAGPAPEPAAKVVTVEHAQALFHFTAVPAKKISPEILRASHWQKGSVNLMDGKMINEEFTGFLSEVGSFLVHETLKTGRHSFAVKAVGQEQIFSYAYQDPATKKDCAQGETVVRWGGGKVSLGAFAKNQYVEFVKCVR